MKKIFLSSLLVASLFTTAQNIGIGTSNPSRAKLEVHGAVDATSAIFGGESSGISLQRNWPGIGYNSYHNNGHRYMSNGFGAVQSLDPVNGFMVFDMFGQGTKGNIALPSLRTMVLSHDGKVNIGSGDAPLSTLQVARGSAPHGTAAFLGTAHNSHFNFGALESTHIRAGKTGSVVFINDIPNGRTALSQFVSINAPGDFGHPLLIKQFDGRALKINDENSSFSWSVRLNPSTLHLDLLFDNFARGRFAWQDGEYSRVSDGRLKKNIQPLSPLLKKVMQLAPVEYEMEESIAPQSKRFGFIAQDVKKLFPELVTVNRDTAHGYKGIDDLHTLNYSGFGVLAIKAIQEQQQLIQSLQAQLNALQKTVNEMQRRSY